MSALAKLNLGLDLAALVAAVTLAAHSEPPVRAAVIGAFLALAAVAWLATTKALRHYDLVPRSALDEAAMVAVLVFAVGTSLGLLAWTLPATEARPDIVDVMAVLGPAALAVRFLIGRLSASRDAPIDEVLIVGTGPLARATAEHLSRGRARRRVIGFLALPNEVQPERVGPALLGSSLQIARVLAANPVAEVYIAANPIAHAQAIRAAVELCETYGIPFALPVQAFPLQRAQPANASAAPDGYVHYLCIDSKPVQRALKRLMDIAATAAALWALLPLFAVVAALIKLTSKGPVFFRQVRVGLHGRHFNMLKFRSMVVNAEELRARLAGLNEQSGPVFKIRNDPRVTSIGRFIRRYSIDELPQLINVLRGDMSLVGPRPPIPSEVATYELWQRRRLSVRPGLTCIWQVSGRNEISFEQWMYMDLQYIDHWSLRWDLDLLLRTVPVVLTGRGAS